MIHHVFGCQEFTLDISPIQDVEKKMKKAIEEHIVVKRKVEEKEINLDQLRADIDSLQKQIDEASNQSV